MFALKNIGALWARYGRALKRVLLAATFSNILELEMATPGRDPVILPGPHPETGMGRSFLKNPPWVFGEFNVIRTDVFIEILL